MKSWIVSLRARVARHPLRWFYWSSLGFALALLPVALVLEVDARLAEAFVASGVPPNTDFVTAARVVWAVPAALVPFLVSLAMVLSPDLAAYAVSALTAGRAGVRRLVRGYRPWAVGVSWRRGGRAWGQMFAVFLGLSLATAGLNALLLPTDAFAWRIEPFAPAFLAALFVATFLDIGGVAEETGWRGFALPLLQARLGPGRAALALGAMWGAWHLPLKFDWLSLGAVPALGLFVLFTVRLVLLSVVMTYFCNRVGGSTLMGIAMHGLHNDAARLQGAIDYDALGVGGLFVVEGALLAPIALAALALWRGTRGRLAYGPADPVPPARPDGGP